MRSKIMDYVFRSVDWIPTDFKVEFYVRFVHWHVVKDVKDLKQAMQKAADELNITLQDAHRLFKECNGHITRDMGAIGNREIALYYLQNGKRLAEESAKVLEAAEAAG